MKKETARLTLSKKLEKQEHIFRGFVKGSVSLKHLCDTLSHISIDELEFKIGMKPPLIVIEEENYREYKHEWED